MQKMQKELQELIREQFKLKMQHGSGQLPKNHLLKNVRKNIARKKTLIRQHEILAVGASK